MALIGGLGTIIGPVIGAFVVIAMQDYLAFVGQLVLVIQGFIFVVIGSPPAAASSASSAPGGRRAARWAKGSSGVPETSPLAAP